MLYNELKGLKSVLSLGAGVSKERTDFWELLERYKIKTAIEADYDKAATWIDSSWMCINMFIINTLPFVDNSFDVVIGEDFIEHLHKTAALDIIKEAERVSRKYVIWFTPVGFLDVQKYQSFDLHSHLDVHNSQWQVNEFKSMGYATQVIKNQHNFGDVHFDAMWVWKSL